ncbi:hypothetical protein GYA37_02080 [candidate division WWE3 bacterium]|uniref:Uncharacterized protein n=1 Tax=candidate division WWE3 bacterium TaxID=2053526 RepID=A0A7X9E7A4_UNCKA|nr:hypothetical protein [candidate division WWE3 bacterium]
MAKSASITFIAESESKVLNLLKKHFTNSCRVEKIVKGGEIKNGGKKGVFTFFSPPEEAEDLISFLDNEDSHGKTINITNYDDSASKSSIWYEVVVL